MTASPAAGRLYFNTHARKETFRASSCLLTVKMSTLDDPGSQEIQGTTLFRLFSYTKII